MLEGIDWTNAVAGAVLGVVASGLAGAAVRAYTTLLDFVPKRLTTVSIGSSFERFLARVRAIIMMQFCGSRSEIWAGRPSISLELFTSPTGQARSQYTLRLGAHKNTLEDTSLCSASNGRRLVL